MSAEKITGLSVSTAVSTVVSGVKRKRQCKLKSKISKAGKMHDKLQLLNSRHSTMRYLSSHLNRMQVNMTPAIPTTLVTMLKMSSL